MFEVSLTMNKQNVILAKKIKLKMKKLEKAESKLALE